CRRVADGGEPRAAAANHDHDGRPDRRAPQPDRGEQSRAPQAALLVRAEPDPPRAAQVSRPPAPRLPGVPAPPRLRRDEPGPAPADRGGARALPEHPARAARALRRRGRRPLRHLQRTALARDDLPARARLHTKAWGKSGSEPDFSGIRAAEFGDGALTP